MEFSRTQIGKIRTQHNLLNETRNSSFFSHRKEKGKKLGTGFYQVLSTTIDHIGGFKTPSEIAIKEQYGEVITLEQLYRICHISKRKAKWLLDNKIIPCDYSGKKIRRYKIKIDDVIDYLETTERNGDITPVGIFSSKCQTESKEVDEFQALYEYLTEEDHVNQLREYYKKLFKQYPDGLTTMQIVQMTGFSKAAVNRWIRNGYLKAYRGKVNLIPKTYLLDFLCSDHYLKIYERSSLQREHLLKFSEQFVKR